MKNGITLAKSVLLRQVSDWIAANLPKKISANLLKSLELIMVLRYTKDTELRIEVF